VEREVEDEAVEATTQKTLDEIRLIKLICVSASRLELFPFVFDL
jgi:hypothetical protein